YGRIEPLGGRFVESLGGVAANVGAVAEGLVDATRIAGIDRERESCLIGHDAIDQPTAQHEVGAFADRSQEALAPPNRYLVDQAGHEPLSGVVACPCIFVPLVAVHHDAFPAS